MPWRVEERDGKFCVITIADGSVKKCYGSRPEAARLVKALYANVPEASMTAVDRLTVKLASVYVHPHERSGASGVEHVSGYWRTLSVAQKAAELLKRFKNLDMAYLLGGGKLNHSRLDAIFAAEMARGKGTTSSGSTRPRGSRYRRPAPTSRGVAPQRYHPRFGV